MPEEANTTQTQTEPTPAATQTTEPTANTAAEPKATEPAKMADKTPAEPELTLDSYKDLGLEEFEGELDFNEEGLKAFKEIGLKHKISPEAMKAITQWSLNETKKSNEAFKKMQEEWRAENEKKYGEDLKNVKTNVGRVFAQMDKSGKFANLLKDAGAEEHPATLEFLSAIGDVILEKGSINPNATIQGKEMSLEDMYRSKN